MKKILLTVTGFIAVAMLFTGVGYAAGTWSNFEGKGDIQQSETNIDKILEILEEVNNGKITAENAIPVLEESIEQLKIDNGILSTNLASKDTQLRKQSETIEKLNADLTSAKTDAENALAGKEQELESKQTEINNKQTEIEAKQAEINEKNQAYDQLQQQRDAIATERNNYKAQVEENNNYVQHLEAELEEANNAAQSVSDKTTEALTKAQGYVNEDVE